MWAKLVAGSGDGLRPRAGTGAGNVLSDFEASKIGNIIPARGRLSPTLSDDKLES